MSTAPRAAPPRPKRRKTPDPVAAGIGGYATTTDALYSTVSPLAQAFARIVGLVWAYAECGEFETIRSALAGLPEPDALDVGRAVFARLEAQARLTGDWRTWATALHHLPHPAERAMRAEFRRRFDAWTMPAPIAVPEPPARKLAKLALRLLRAGASSGAILHRLDEANSTFDIPVSAARVGAIAIWAAKRQRSSNVAG